MKNPNVHHAANQARTWKKGEGGKGRFSPPTIPVIPFASETKLHYTPWLLVRDAAGDTGARPLDGSAVFWESPDVWSQSSLGINQPIVGQPNQVFARVTNLGWQYATGVIVKFWWANPSLAITETTANLIGIGFANIPSGWSVVVECPVPWVPILENGGHECLLAEAYIPFFDPLSSPMNPVDDRHVRQKNETVVQLAPGQSFTTRIHALNVFGLPQSLTFDVQALRLAVIHPLVAARAALHPLSLKPPSSVLPLSLRISDAPSGLHRPLRRFPMPLSFSPGKAVLSRSLARFLPAPRPARPIPSA
jgi:hypothetical protein